jgi:anaerobic selenocysteine-containing dehydrogenase
VRPRFGGRSNDVTCDATTGAADETEAQSVSTRSGWAKTSKPSARVTATSVSPAASATRAASAVGAETAQTTGAPEWVGDYAKIRHAIEETWPATFKGLNARMFEPGGIIRPLAARERKWNTRTGKANFIAPTQLFAGHVETFGQPGVFQLVTFRSNDQFNTTVYGFDDRFRGVKGTRMVVFLNPDDLIELGFHEGDFVDLTGVIEDGVPRSVQGFRVVSYAIPKGCVGAYFPEANALVPLGHHDRQARTPAYKATPVRITRSSVTEIEQPERMRP